MVQAASLICLVVGALLVAVVTHIAVPPATWLALILLLHASRSMPAVSGILYLWLALYAALAIGNRGILPVSGAAYFAIVAFSGDDGYVAVRPRSVRGAAARRVGIDPDLPDGIRRCRVPAIAAVAGRDVGFARLHPVRKSPVDAAGGVCRPLGHHLPDRLVRVDVRLGLESRLRVERRAHAGPDVRGRRCGRSSLGGSVRLALAPTDRPSLRMATLNRPVDLFAPGEMTRIAEGRVFVRRAHEAGAEADAAPRLVSGRQPARGARRCASRRPGRSRTC